MQELRAYLSKKENNTDTMLLWQFNSLLERITKVAIVAAEETDKAKAFDKCVPMFEAILVAKTQVIGITGGHAFPSLSKFNKK